MFQSSCYQWFNWVILILLIPKGTLHIVSYIISFLSLWNFQDKLDESALKILTEYQTATVTLLALISSASGDEEDCTSDRILSKRELLENQMPALKGLVLRTATSHSWLGMRWSSWMSRGPVKPSLRDSRQQNAYFPWRCEVVEWLLLPNR